MASAYNQNFENVQNLLGTIVLDEEEGIRYSSGELENQQNTADVICHIFRSCQRFLNSASIGSSDVIYRLIIRYPSFSYIVTYDSRKKMIYIAKNIRTIAIDWNVDYWFRILNDLDATDPIISISSMDSDGTPAKEFLNQAFWFIFSISGISTIICYIIIGILFFLYFSHFLTIFYAKKLLNTFNRDIFLQLHPPETLPSVSIIKPLKGSDCNLYNNVETYLQLDYPKYEVIFCIEKDDDPSHQVVDRLIRNYPECEISKVKGSPPRFADNPKVSNMVPGMKQAKHEILWMADANVYVKPTTLLEMVSHFVNVDGVGLVHQLPLSISLNNTIAECLEVVYFCTSHARIYLIAYVLGVNTANGMSMLFPKGVLKDLSSGMKSYLSSSMEDNRIGKDVKDSKQRVRLSTIPLYQNFGSRSVDAFRKRMIRWSRIRFYFLPLTTLEPFIECFPIGFLASIAFYYLYNVNPVFFFFIHVLIWLFLDIGLSYALISKPLGGFGVNYLLAWFLREGMVITNWCQAIVSKQINWGGHIRTLQCCTDEYSSTI